MALDYLDFNFNGQLLSDFGGLVAGPNGWNPLSILPAMDKRSEKVLGRDGNIFYNANFNPRTFVIPLVFEDVVDLAHIRDVAAWLGTKEPKDFYFVDDTVKISCMIDGILNWQHFDLNGIVELKFIAYDPYYYLVTDDSFTYNKTEATAGQTFSVQGNVDAFPLITLTGYTNPSFTFDSQIMTITGTGTTLIIDCLNKTIVDGSGNNKITELTAGVFPILTGNASNTVTLTNPGTSSLTSIQIDTRARYI